ncbi:acetyl-CoA carboxylase biotin carboxyl carrier protein [Cytobacillus sp. IB215665]|uniref:acetyl-CoA carboxylase biotin carboxyl carrier protein n=1 Tax=Cytobacillus sp. IB215665 TaxID=3097357 RepID=UPI002A0D9572|nr:acetyl-CoA carboxylase biotin carboxyl carrier protein [Cytobacillus sp. IB215665]MDX8364284.1 acetyl-CoA carboxylase biotin carboxyl carrier protein [Cytobacillus sp. IB215665]
MLKIQEIRELIKLVDQSNIDEFVYENEGSKIKMKKQGTVTKQTLSNIAVEEVQKHQPVAPTTELSSSPVSEVPAESSNVRVEAERKGIEEQTNLHKITSPMVGTFYAAPSPDSDKYVSVGDSVQNNTVVCIVEAMKLFNEIEAEVKGEIVDILAEDGQLVEYGQPLFLVKPV